MQLYGPSEYEIMRKNFRKRPPSAGAHMKLADRRAEDRGADFQPGRTIFAPDGLPGFPSSAWSKHVAVWKNRFAEILQRKMYPHKAVPRT